MAGIKQLGEAGLGAPAAERPAVAAGWGGWTRTWRFLIWEWTIDTGDSEWLVETVQHRFLGEEVIHRYSRTLWMLMTYIMIAMSVLFAAAMVLFAYLAIIDDGIRLGVIWPLFAVSALVVAGCVGIAYFTLVPPKVYRS